ncbi:hypothetical protein BKA62DRAFT_696367 [Auriculariales sp. MPI-PUGE-AT-0066]|nr:hypothetical protein BKA62DRAFT_696367 [Auriculariales sp. MPI-PUGE-AT-0066]
MTVVLSPALQQALEEVAISTFHGHLHAHASTRASALTVHDTVAAIVATVRMALTPALCEFNRNNMLFIRFPREIWCRIWEQLPPGDSMTVTHVCHDWREMACAHPRLWNTLEYSARLRFENEEVAKVLSTSKFLLEMYIKRSSRLPLSLEVMLEDFVFPDGDFYAEDAIPEGVENFIISYAARVTSLSISADCVLELQAFITILESLSHLTFLRIYGCSDEHDLAGHLYFPSLQRFELDAQIEFDRTGFSFSAPSLRVLEVDLYGSQHYKLCALIVSCTVLQELSINFGHHVAYTKEGYDRIRQLLSNSLRRICLKNVSIKNDMEAEFMATFNRPELEHFQLQLEGIRSLQTLSVLRNVPEPPQPYHQHSIMIPLDGSINETPDEVLHSLWQGLSPRAAQSLVKLTMHESLLTRNFREIGESCIRELEIIFWDEKGAFGRWLDANQGAAEPLFPMLDSLALQAESGSGMEASQLASKIASALCIRQDKRLRQLRLEGFNMNGVGAGNQDSWNTLALQVLHFQLGVQLSQ